MHMTEIQAIAKLRGLAVGKLKSKTDLIRAIQRAEGNFDCFGTATRGECNQFNCLWRGDCLVPSDAAVNAGTSVASRAPSAEIELPPVATVAASLAEPEAQLAKPKAAKKPAPAKKPAAPKADKKPLAVESGAKPAAEPSIALDSSSATTSEEKSAPAKPGTAKTPATPKAAQKLSTKAAKPAPRKPSE